VKSARKAVKAVSFIIGIIYPAWLIPLIGFLGNYCREAAWHRGVENALCIILFFYPVIFLFLLSLPRQGTPDPNGP